MTFSMGKLINLDMEFSLLLSYHQCMSCQEYFLISLHSGIHTAS